MYVCVDASMYLWMMLVMCVCQCLSFFFQVVAMTTNPGDGNETSVEVALR